jgi:hypothetical protein
VQARIEDCGSPGFATGHPPLALAGKAIRREREDQVRTSITKALARRDKQSAHWPGWELKPPAGRGVVARAGMAMAVTAVVAMAVTAVVAVAATTGPAAAAVSTNGGSAAGAGMLTSSAAHSTGWSVVPTKNQTAPTGQLNFGTCITASACVAVGTYVKASGVGVSLAERWNGRKWAVQKTSNPAGAAVSTLAGVACATRSSCMAVGYWVTRSGTLMPLAERWNGTQWRLERMPSPAGSRQAFPIAVACTSSLACMAVGYYVSEAGVQLNLTERWNGTRWAIQRTPSLTGTQFAFLDDLSCTSASACTAVGQTNKGTLAERWNGIRWRVQRTPNPSQGGATLLGVACTSASSCTAAGNSNAGTLAERWNGNRWTIQATPNPAGSQFIFLNSVGCSARSACTAVGAYNSSSGDFLPVAERWNGRRWTIERTPSPRGANGNFLFAVACPAQSACTAFGLSGGSGTALTMVQRWNGSRWNIQRTPNPVGDAESQFYAVACTNRSACIGVGAGGNAALAERWNGTKWSKQPLPRAVGGFLNGVSCTSPSACIAVGGSASGNLAERWNGTTWTNLPIPTPAGAHGSGMSSIACTSSSDCIAAGGYQATSSPAGPFLPLTEQWNGSSWTVLTTPSPAGAVQVYLNGISCTSASACTITGEQHSASGVVHTVAERWDGANWTIQPTPNPSGVQFASLWGVDCTGPSACLTVGSTDQGTLAERWDGSSWTIDTTMANPPSGGQLFGIACPTPSACTAMGFTFTGTGAMVLAEHWNGSSWSIQPTPLIPAANDMGLPAVACTSTVWCIAVTGYSNDGGNSVTLAEQWRGGGASAPASYLPVTAAGSGAICAPPVMAVTEADTAMHWRTRCSS